MGNDGLQPVDSVALATSMLAGDTGNNSTENENEPESGDEGTKLGGHPAWQEVLSVIPAEYHEALTPKLKEWDAGVTRRFQEIHSEYEPLKSFEPLVEQGVDVDTLSNALGMFQALNTDPRGLYEALGEAYGFVSEQESTDEDDDYDNDYRIPPEVQRQLNEQQLLLEQMAEYMQGQQTSQQEIQEQELLDSYLEGLQSEYGEFDMDYVLTKMAAGVDGELAVREYQDKFPVGASGNNGGTQPPQVFGSSGAGQGGIPSASPKVTDLSGQETRDLVAEMLRQTAEQSRD